MDVRHPDEAVVRQPMSRLLVVRLGSLGDLVHALPAVAAIRRAHPSWQIDWLVDAVHREFLDLVPILSSVITLDERSPRGWLRVRRKLRAHQYDIAIDFQGLIKSALLARLSGARRVIGFERHALRERGAAAFYTERVAAGHAPHVIDKNCALAASLGADVSVREFPLGRPSSSALETLRRDVTGHFALLNCGAAWPNKRWPPQRFGGIARWLFEKCGWRSVVLWGPGEEALAADVARASRGAAVVAPATTLADLVAFAREAQLMVSGDTGPTHIASAVGTPVVALFGPTSPSRNGPWDPDDVVLSEYARCDCHYQRSCRRVPDEWCLGRIGEEDVRHAIDARLSGGHSS